MSSLSRRLVRMSAVRCVCVCHVRVVAGWGWRGAYGPERPPAGRRSNAPTREGGEGQGWAAVAEVPAPGR